MFLVDTNVLSETRKVARANPNVLDFFFSTEQALFLPVQVIGEIRSGIEALRQRGDLLQAQSIQNWFQNILAKYSPRILAFDLDCAQKWGQLMGVNDQHIVDRQIAAIALAYNLTVVSRNTNHFERTGVRLYNPFSADALPQAGN